MSGRREHIEDIKATVQRNLAGYPKILWNYFEDWGGSQWTSKKVYAYRARQFYDYIKDNAVPEVATDDTAWAKVTTRQVKDYIKFIKVERDKTGNPVVNEDGETVYKSSKTVRDNILALRNWFQFLTYEKVIVESPMPDKIEVDKLVEKEKKAHVVVAMNRAEVNTVAESIRETSDAPKRDELIFKMGCEYGLRAQALSEIDISDIDLRNRIMTVTDKGNDTRDVRLGNKIIVLIRECLAERSAMLEEWGYDGPKIKALFIKKYAGQVKRISKRHIDRLIARNTADLDKHITPHKMRSTCITTMYDLTGDIYAAARKAGHHNVRNTMLYISTEEADEKNSDALAEYMWD